jgi:hypothetical protein
LHKVYFTKNAANTKDSTKTVVSHSGVVTSKGKIIVCACTKESEQVVVT